MESDHVFADSGYDDTLLWDISEVQSGNLAAGLIGSVTAVIDPQANVTSTVVGGNSTFSPLSSLRNQLQDDMICPADG